MRGVLHFSQNKWVFEGCKTSAVKSFGCRLSVTTEPLGTLANGLRLRLLRLRTTSTVKITTSVKMYYLISRRITYSSRASRSNICTCCLASLTAARAFPSARSASRSLCSASATFCFAARIEGSFLKSRERDDDDEDRRREKSPPPPPLRLLEVL